MMVDVSYQMVLSTLQTVGLLVGIVYYILDLQNKREDQRIANTRQELMLKSQEQALHTRQAQLLSTYSGWAVNSDTFRKAIMYWFEHEPLEYNEFKEKYPVNSEGYQQLFRIFQFYELLGVMCRWELVEMDLVADMFILMWNKLKPIVKGMQEDYGMTDFMGNYEWLGESRAGKPIKRGFN